MRHADPRALDHRFTIGRVLTLAGRALLASRWAIALLVVPTALVSAAVHWLQYAHIDQMVSVGWQQMIGLWLDVPVNCIAFAGVICAALSYARSQRTGARDVLNMPWRRMPAVLVAGFILQSVTYWPIPLLSWPEKFDYLLLTDYLILTINVLTFDVLTFVFMPALLMENRSIVGTFRRSVELVARHPWRILAIDAGLWMVYVLYGEAAGQIYGLIGPSWLAWSASTVAWIAIMLPITNCFIAAAYHLLRNEQEGPAPDTLAHVFE